MDVEVSATSPACSTGFRRYCPLPSCTMDWQASKSIFRSLVSPAAIVNWPPAICPLGILMPVRDSLEMLSGTGVVGFALSTTQLAVEPQAFEGTVALLSAR